MAVKEKTMLVSFFPRGTGRGSGPVQYCIAEQVAAFDPETRRRVVDPQTGEVLMKTRSPAPTIMEGDPARTEMLINASSNKWKYTSGVIAFADEDAPTEAEQREVMADFEAAAFAGLDREQYDILWVRHEHEGNIELHFVVPRLELRTGKALNIAPPGYQKFFDAWRDSWNYKKGWASPDDPARARLVSGPDFLKKLKAPDAREQITEWLTGRIEAGMVSNRADVVASLEELGEITRQGKDYVSVKPEGFDKAIRLRGAIYAESFDAGELIRDLAPETADRQTANRSIDLERAAKAGERLKAAVKRRAEFNAGRYRIQSEPAIEQDSEANRSSNQAHEPSTIEGEQGSPEPAAVDSSGLDAADLDHRMSLSEHISRSLGADAIPVQHHSEPVAANRDAAAGIGGHRGQDVGGDIQRRQERSIFSVARRDEAGSWLERWKQAGREAWTGLRGAYDRTRTAFDRWVTETVGAVQAGHDAATSAKLALTAAGTGVNNASAEIEQGVSSLERQTERAIGNLKMQRADELERFKTEINLVEYAEVMGYEIDPKESSRASTVMRNGGDKIIVATGQDGHGVYFSVRNDADNGSIIDFVQRRKNLNLGQVRKELRPWIGGGGQRRQVERKPPEMRPQKPEPSSKDRQRVMAAWMGMRATEGHHPYLEDVRKIATTTLADKRFAGHVRMDARGNAVFPHYDLDGLSGYELKNEGFTGFSKGGTKALWRSANLSYAPRVVFVESAIDAMSHAQLTGDTETAYVSTGGSMSDSQRELVRQVIERSAARGAEIVIATDADEAGQKLAQELAQLAPKGLNLRQEEPQGAKDWNDMLQAALERQNFKHYRDK